MDMETSLPLLYPLRYHIDHLAFRSLSTQSASLQSVKFFYEFWRQKYGVSFCYSFYSSDHNPDIAIGEMPAFWLYLENGHNVQSNVLSLTRVRKANSLTHTARVRAVVHFISFLINTYISPAYRDDSPKVLSLLTSRLHTRLQLCRENYRTLTPNKFLQHSHSSQGFQSMSGAMVLSLYGIITPSSAQKHNPLNPFPSGQLQFRNFLIIRLLLNYGLRIGELLLLECSSIKPNLKGDKFSLIVTTVDEGYEPRKNAR
ncbi:integrase [Escherichia coli]|uniref:integrase n=1 Tax=Escherichia coli TaxID=562 RepID=UPI0030C86A24